MKPQPLIVLSVTLLAIAAASLSVRAENEKKPAAAVKPTLTVTVVQPQSASLAQKLSANGSLAAWQEASIGAESGGLRLAEVQVNVGDVVKRGQLLASFATDTVAAELAQGKASVAEAQATLAEATVNAERARRLQPSGALSAQQVNQYLTAEQTASARLAAQQAAVKVQQLRLDKTRVLAPDSGVISARSATVGAVVPAGQELFRMIRQGRLEWRAEVASTELAQLKPGMGAIVTPANGAAIKGVIRMVAPTVDTQTRNGLVYVDLPAPGMARAGMFARGEIELGSAPGITLPQSAVLPRDGFSYVLRVLAAGAHSKVAQTRVTLGRRVADRIEITGGLDAAARVVTSGGAFLADGDTVRVVDATAAPSAVPK